MSLLLDALKKAAEQKAAKGDQTVTRTASTSDETIVLEGTRTIIDNTRAFDEDRSKYQGDETLSGGRKPAITADSVQTESDAKLAKEDKTELLEPAESTGFDGTETELVEPVESTRFDGTETELVEPVESTRFDGTQTELAEPTESTMFDGDETVVLDDEDVTEFLDEHDVTQIVAKQEDASEILSDTDDTDVTVPDYEENATRVDTQHSLDVDSTVVIDSTATQLSNTDEDVTVALTVDDVTAFLGEHELPVKPPVKPPVNTESTEATSPDTKPETTPTDKDHDGRQAEDISLSLIDAEDSSDSHITDAEVELLGQGAHSTESLSLIDIAPDKAPDHDTLTNRSVPLGKLTNEETVARQDSTSTRTYAPDNYDRTLIKVDQDDASRLFAGMKSESDVVMTPDYAKKLFISNSSVQRFNNYKIYTGVGATIFLIIVILGLFEFEAQSESIDNSLRALKRDPMPILPQPSAVKDQINLFPQTDSTGIDTKTLALVENAGNLSEITPKSGEIIDDDAEVSGTIKSSVTAIETKTTEQASTTSNEGTENSEIAVISKPVASSAARDVDTSDGSLRIASKNIVVAKDQLLKDAYAAYQRGDNDTAMQKYNQVLTEDPDNRNALLARAAINVQNNNGAEAIQDYQTILVANPKDSLAMSSLLTVASISPAKSESQLKVMIRDEPTSPHLNFALANVYGAQNRWQEAQTFYFTALENNPTDPNYAYNLAVSLEHIAKPRIAVTYYRRALANFNNGLATFNREVVDQRVEILQQL